jgi:hypothetical protein
LLIRITLAKVISKNKILSGLSSASMAFVVLISTTFCVQDFWEKAFYKLEQSTTDFVFFVVK